MRHLLFSYGTLQDSEVQLELFGRTIAGSPDSLIRYKTVPIRFAEHAFQPVVEQPTFLIAVSTGNPADEISGTVLELSADELATADKYEPDDYERIGVRLTSGRDAWVYVQRR